MLHDIAFLGWACHAEGHLGRHAFEGLPEDAFCSRGDTFELSQHESVPFEHVGSIGPKSVFTEVTNWDGRATCFGQQSSL